MSNRGCYLTLAHSVGDTIRFVLDDDGKKHQGKIVKINITLTNDTTEVDYEIRTTFRGKRDYVIIDSKEIL